MLTFKKLSNLFNAPENYKSKCIDGNFHNNIFVIRFFPTKLCTQMLIKIYSEQ